MIHIWYDGMTQCIYSSYEGRRLKMNATEGVNAYVDELCKDNTNGNGATRFPYTHEVWDKLLEYGVEVVR